MQPREIVGSEAAHRDAADRDAVRAGVKASRDGGDHLLFVTYLPQAPPARSCQYERSPPYGNAMMGCAASEPCERLEHRVVQGGVLIGAPPVQEDEERPWVSFGGALGQHDGYRKLPGNGFALHLDPFDLGTPLVHRSDDAAGFEHGPGQYERGTDCCDGNDAAAQDQRPGRGRGIHWGAAIDIGD